MELEAYLSSDVWVFRQNGQHRWVWRHISVDGELIRESVAEFICLDACMHDATRYGYVANKASPSHASVAHTRPPRALDVFEQGSTTANDLSLAASGA